MVSQLQDTAAVERYEAYVSTCFLGSSQNKKSALVLFLPFFLLVVCVVFTESELVPHRFVRKTCNILHEPKVSLIRSAVHFLGVEVVTDLLHEVISVARFLANQMDSTALNMLCQCTHATLKAMERNLHAKQTSFSVWRSCCSIFCETLSLCHTGMRNSAMRRPNDSWWAPQTNTRWGFP